MIDNAKRVEFFTRNAVFLTPIKAIKTLKSRGIMTFDIETKDGLIAKSIFCWTLAYKEGKVTKVLSDRNDSLTESCSLEKLFKFLEQKPKDSKHKRIIFVHNLYFEARHLILYCSKNEIKYHACLSGSNMLTFSIPELSVKFVDSTQFLQSTQESAEIDYNVDISLRKIDCKDLFEKSFSKWTKLDKERVFQHNQNDSKALLEIMHKYRKIIFENAGIDMITCTSLATMSLKSFRVTLKEKIQNPFIYLWFDIERKRFIYKYQKYEEGFVRRSYYGGRNEVFNLNLVENAVYIDRVSMYPSVMKFKKFPVGIPVWENDKGKLMEIIKGNIDYEGFIECQIIPNKQKYPILPERINKRILFTSCKKTNVYAIPELRFAYKMGYKIKPIVGLIFEQSAFVFREFVDKFYKIKSENKGGKRQSAKITLNSCYGKFGEAFERKANKMYYFLTFQEQLEFLQENEEKLNIVKNTHDLEQDIYISIESVNSIIIKPHQNVAWASYVTAYSRIALLEKLLYAESMGIEVYYSDTDSFTCNKEILKYIKLSEELGGWNIENIFFFVKFLAPKCYIYDYYDKKKKIRKYKIKMKGIQKAKLEEIENLADFYFDDLNVECRKKGLKFIELMLKEPIKMAERYMTFNESHRGGTLIGSKELCKHYTMSNLKRKFYENGFSEAWIDSNLPKEFKKKVYSHE